MYGAPSLKACQSQLESFRQQWNQYPGAIDVWVRNFKHVEQLFDYGSAIRKIMYTTNAIENVHAIFRKVTKKRRLLTGKRLTQSPLFTREGTTCKVVRGIHSKLVTSHEPASSFEFP
ncbi:hypothetical protein LMxysn_0783 [Listeria monocytogenes]|nr:hypothetical protein LMxysn_0783 [Listeria monocytogenes]